jgi:23S rRNA (guanosine2251-2'-O)-methyltransferase
VLVPERRSAGMTAAAWRTSAGAAARLPVARCTNLARTLKQYREAGLFVAGLAMDGSVPLDDLELATEPLVLVVGSRGTAWAAWWSVLRRDRVDPDGRRQRVPERRHRGAVVLAEVARRRRTA